MDYAVVPNNRATKRLSGISVKNLPKDRDKKPVKVYWYKDVYESAKCKLNYCENRKANSDLQGKQL